jgi:phosphoribosylformylglycinamidine synthase
VCSSDLCSDGGLAVALAESAIQARLGFRGTGWRKDARLDAMLFGEAPSRIVVSLAPEKLAALQQIAARHRVPVTMLGEVGGDRFAIDGVLDVALLDAARAWVESLGKLIV